MATDNKTLKCPKCKTVWRVLTNRDDEIFAEAMGMTVESDEFYCPAGCRNFLRFRIKGIFQAKQSR